MKKTLALVAVSVLCVPLFGQERTSKITAKIANDTHSTFYFGDLEYTPEGKLSVFGRMGRVGTVSLTKGGKSAGPNVNKNIPSVMAVSVDNGVTTIKREYINITSIPSYDLKGYDYTAADPSTYAAFASSAKDKSLNELMVEYPQAFGQAKQETESFYDYQVEAGVWAANVREIETKYLLDGVRNKLMAQKPQQRIIAVKLPELTDGKYLYETQFLKDNKRKMVTLVTQMTKKGESKFYPMQNRKVVTLASSGEIINSIDLTHTYPRALMFGGALGMSVSDSVTTFEDGGIFIFGRVFGGGKSNDPDETNYDFVITGGNGELVSKGAFKFGTPKRDLSPLYAYKKNGKIFLLAKGVGKEDPGYAVLTFDNTGHLGTKEYPTAVLQSKTIGPYMKGITTNYGRLLYVTNHINMKDGSVLLCGEAYEDDTPVGASFTDPKVRKYLSQIFLFIDAEGNLVRNLVIEKNDPELMKSYTKQIMLGEVNNKLVFVSQEKNGQLIYPTLTTVDPVGGQTKRILLRMDDVYNIDGDIIYRHYPDRNQVLFIGRNTDTDTYTLNAVVYTIN